LRVLEPHKRSDAWSGVVRPDCYRVATTEAAVTSPDERRQADYERHLYEGYQHAHRDYDQAILTLASGTLALSATFATSLTPAPVAGSVGYLVTGWVSLGVAIITIIASFLVSQWAFRDRLANLDQVRPITYRERFTGFLNLVAGLGLLGGLVALALYATVNLTK
jgi:hypothetical protein